MTPEELKAKFTECASQTISQSSAERIAEYVEHLETMADIKRLCQLLTGQK
jgi:hypothetical protein